ncbi:hypothetical protein INN71_08690 [Nocardioides sp. ChNu-153]|uniref:hypothetical protein n=1 Tax=Nocardioides sp. ChNu-153 TaxID=2779364 RepID=UPI0026540176|nr:hypothetical protein [Nocardioides sp. ChNu-153]MDN7121466.1 hypothetical protein [Nocardioides sp. ChNu-153]
MARLLEIFLDRVAWRAATQRADSAAYLLDDAYESSVGTADRALKAALRALGDRPEAADSPAWPHVRELLERLGEPPHMRPTGRVD